jgi:hypothetical protein
MKKYYLHIGTENSGPFSLDELKIKRITKKTPVWFEGLENWKYAEDIDELRNIFIVIPPPIESFKKEQSFKVEEEVKKIVKEESKPVTILGLSKNNFFIVLTFLLLVIGTFIFNSYQEKRDRELEQKNHKTEVENHQYELQQKQIEEQKIAIAEQEQKEAERVSNEKKQADNNRLIVIHNLLSLANENLENAKIKLNDASGFKFLRTATEKKEQMDQLKNEINSYLIQIDSLKKESNLLKLELEKIK